MSRSRTYLPLLATLALTVAACDPPRVASRAHATAGHGVVPTAPPAAVPSPAPVAPDFDSSMRQAALHELRDPEGQLLSSQILGSRLLVVNFWSPF